MKKLLLLSVMSCVIAGTAMAQETKEHKDHKGMMKADHMAWDKKVKTDLKLTDDQSMKYDAVCKEYGDKMEAAEKDVSLNKDAQKEKKMALKKEKQAKLSEIFTPEQQTKYNEMMMKMKADKPKGY